MQGTNRAQLRLQRHFTVNAATPASKPDLFKPRGYAGNFLSIEWPYLTFLVAAATPGEQRGKRRLRGDASAQSCAEVVPLGALLASSAR